MYVTEVPEQTGFEDAAAETATGRFGFTWTAIVLLVAGFPVAQASDEVRMQLTMSLSVGTYVKTGLFVPALPPFTFHW